MISIGLPGDTDEFFRFSSTLSALVRQNSLILLQASLKAVMSSKFFDCYLNLQWLPDFHSPDSHPFRQCLSCSDMPGRSSTKVENLKRVPQLPLHCSQLDYNNSNQQQEQRNQQLQQQDQQQQQQQNQIVSDGMSDDRDRDISGVEEINTKEVAAQITAELKRYSIPQAIFAQRVLCRSQVIK